MFAVAEWLARQLWWGMLWLMRRQWMRRLQTIFERFLSDEGKERMRLSLIRQNRFARRHGLRMLTVSLLLMLYSLTITASYYIALWALGTGFFNVPEPPAPTSTKF